MSCEMLTSEKYSAGHAEMLQYIMDKFLYIFYINDHSKLFFCLPNSSLSNFLKNSLFIIYLKSV